MKIVRVLAFFFLVLGQIVSPIINMIILDYPEWYAICQIIPVMACIICFMLEIRPSLNKFVKTQQNFLLGYVFTAMCIYFGWNIHDLKGFN